MRPTDISASLPRHPTKKNKIRNSNRIEYLILHTTDLFRPSIQEIAEYHICPNSHLATGGAPSFSYHDVITPRKVYNCVPYEEITWHAAGYNNKSVAVSLHYKCQDQHKQPLIPSENMMKLTYSHLAALCFRFKIPTSNIYGHRELKGTGWILDRKGHKRLKKLCPGMLVNLDEVRTNVTKIIQIELFKKFLYSGAIIDGIWGPKTEEGFRLYYS